MNTTPFVRLAGICAVVLACAMSACGGSESTTSGDSDAGALPDAAWQEEPGTLHPDRANCLDRPEGTCKGNEFFTVADQKCNPAQTCTYMKYALDENGCLVAIGAPSGGERDLQQCVADEISKTRWTCAANPTWTAYFGPCLIK